MVSFDTSRGMVCEDAFEVVLHRVSGLSWSHAVVAPTRACTRRWLRASDDRIARVSFDGTETFEECRARLVGAVDAAFGPGGVPSETVEVDVVANSMGGLIAVYAADPDGPGRRLRIARLFGLSAPFRGATMANVPTRSQILIDMRPGSEFLAELWADGKARDYEISPYVRLGDTLVGVEHTAPPGEHPWWVPNAPFESAHITAFTDVRIRADVLRRLRGEAPYTSTPRTPPP